MIPFEYSAEFWSAYACYWRLALLNHPEEFEVIAFNEAKFKVPRIKSKFIRQAKKQGNFIHNEEINQIVENNPEVTQLLESVDENFKTMIITVFYMFKKLET